MYSSFLSLLTLHPLEEIRYSVLFSQGPFEIRLYPRMTMAKIRFQEDFQSAMKLGQHFLEEYCSGNNFRVSKIERSGSFFVSNKGEFWEISTLLPEFVSAIDAPKPINRQVWVEELPPGQVGVLKFSGHTDQEIFKRKSDELVKWLTHRKLSFIGPYRAYKPDYSLPVPFLRQNEVHLDLI